MGDVMTTAIAMSGGVDSSTAAALLVGNNSDRVIGLTMQLWNQRRLPSLLGVEGESPSGHASGRCCSLDDVYDARRVADFLGIPYYVVNFQERFEQTVVRPFVEQYLTGETPIPCAHCNTEIKFEQFVKTALEIGAERIATGHYARLQRNEATGRYRLFRSVDTTKDQTYFLFGLTQEQLSHSLFPLGDLTKEQVRAIARERKLPVAEKAESQEICFVPTGSYREFIEAYLAEQGKKSGEQVGEIVSTDGRVLAEHAGVHHYTVGQRKGLGFATGEPLYVIQIDRAENRVVVGKNEELFLQRFAARDVNWIRPVSEGEGLTAQVKIRNKHVAAPARVEATTSGAMVVFLEPQRAITPGQAAVFYDGDEVVGGGWISKVL
ncbi:MAG: tRNA 2-thiouridine(34) synthase MnmA [Acidobacteria bacterium]|nr:tRNA 2-thiouridine(34) synthase MnmA [Acidobacteriota bacterium]